jgi:hypothetical protein
MIDFYYKRKGFQTLFENCFEILEKEKKMEIFSLLSFWPEGPAFSPLSGCSAWISPGPEMQGAQPFLLFALAQVQRAGLANKVTGPFAPLPTLFR